MINELDAIRKHLGIQIAGKELDHYTLLGLNRNASSNDIKQALQSVVNSWNQSESKTDVAASKLIAKWIKQAQATLLDKSKRQEYDASLSRSGISSAPSLFPDADPFAPFEPQECLVGAAASQMGMSFGSPNERWSALTRRIPDLLHTNADASNDASPAIEPAPSMQFEYNSAKRGPAAMSRIEQLKRKRQFTQRAYLIGLLLFAMAFLGYAGIRFSLNRMQVAQNRDLQPDEPNIVDNPNKNQVKPQAKPQDKPTKTIGGTLAPQGSMDTSQLVLPTLRREEAAESVTKEYTDSNPFGVTPKDPSTMPSNNVGTKPETPSMVEPAMNPLSMNTPATTPTGQSKPMESPKPMEPTTVPSDGSTKAEWIAAMKGARDAVNNADFKLFEEKMKIALPLSGNKDMEDQRARLDQLGQLYRIFIKAVQDAKSKMKGSETISVGRNVISIVEITADELIVRAAGSNQRYRWDRLPPGIAEAMADFSLSDRDPTDLAARAVYFSLSPARNELYAKKIQGWFEKSVGKGDIRKDLVQALSDKYE